MPSTTQYLRQFLLKCLNCLWPVCGGNGAGYCEATLGYLAPRGTAKGASTAFIAECTDQPRMKRETKVLLCLKSNRRAFASSKADATGILRRCQARKSMKRRSLTVHNLEARDSGFISAVKFAGFAVTIGRSVPLGIAGRKVSSLTKLKIAVGSTRRPKIAAVSEALECLGPVLAPTGEFEVIGVDVASGVGHTPANREELMLGARQRAEARPWRVCRKPIRMLGDTLLDWKAAWTLSRKWRPACLPRELGLRVRWAPRTLWALRRRGGPRGPRSRSLAKRRRALRRDRPLCRSRRTSRQPRRLGRSVERAHQSHGSISFGRGRGFCSLL
jgi:Protein of unknown function DUF84